MNLLLLETFARRAEARCHERRIRSVRFLAPILTVELDPHPRLYLTAILQSPGPFVFVSKQQPLEGALPPKRFRALETELVEHIRVQDDDRVLTIVCRGHSALKLNIALFGGSPRVNLTRGDTILESIGPRREGPTRHQPCSILTATADELKLLFRDHAEEMAESPQSLVPGLDRPMVDAFTRGDHIDLDGLVAFRNATLGGASFQLASPGKAGAATPVPASSDMDLPMSPVFHSTLDACEHVGGEILAVTHKQLVDRMARPFRDRRSAARKLISRLERDIEAAAGFEGVRREAEVLSAFRAQVPRGADRVTLPGLYEQSESVEITLDPAEPLNAQIDRRFQRAGKMEKRLVHARSRLEMTREELVRLDAVLKLLAGEPSFGAALTHIEAARAAFDIPDDRTSRRDVQRRAARTLRRFELDENWFIVVGRNNAENEEITFDVGGPNDLWFHAQGVAGSHVILKSRSGSARGNPPDPIIEKAASVAAHYSKARHSHLVPVIYTLRKYVRKFRGARPGQVRCERETMVMVPPVLPERPSNDPT